MSYRWIIICALGLILGGLWLGIRDEDRSTSKGEQSSHGRADAASGFSDQADVTRRPSKLPRSAEEDSAGQFIRAKLKSIVIPTIAFDDTSVEEAIDFLRMSSIAQDRDEADPARKGISFLIRKPHGDLDIADTEPALPAAVRLNLRATDISLWDALHRVAREAGLKVEITDRGIELQAP